MHVHHMAQHVHHVQEAGRYASTQPPCKEPHLLHNLVLVLIAQRGDQPNLRTTQTESSQQAGGGRWRQVAEQ